MKKYNKLLFKIALIVLSLVAGFVGYSRYTHTQKEEAEYELQTLYKYQNMALAIDLEKYNDRTIFHGSDEIDMKMLVLSLYTYSLSKPEQVVSVQEVVEYLGKEYSEDGSLMVYSCPDSIKDYIDWWWEGGDQKIMNFLTRTNAYLRNNGYEYYYEDMSVEELQEILPLVKVEN